MLYIGIDGGGTKTKMVLFDEDGTRLKNLILPTVHVLTQPQDQAIEILRNAEVQPKSLWKRKNTIFKVLDEKMHRYKVY